MTRQTDLLNSSPNAQLNQAMAGKGNQMLHNTKTAVDLIVIENKRLKLNSHKVN